MTLWLVGRENRTGTSVSMIIEGEVVEWSLYISITCSQTLHYTSTRSDKHIPRWLQTLGQWHVASFIEATILLPEKLCSATRFSSYRLRLARNCVLLSWKRPKIKSSFLQIVSYPQSSCGLSHTLISPPLVSVQLTACKCLFSLMKALEWPDICQIVWLAWQIICLMNN